VNGRLIGRILLAEVEDEFIGVEADPEMLRISTFRPLALGHGFVIARQCTRRAVGARDGNKKGGSAAGGDL
jgi:hypothetical protein